MSGTRKSTHAFFGGSALATLFSAGNALAQDGEAAAEAAAPALKQDRLKFRFNGSRLAAAVAGAVPLLLLATDVRAQEVTPPDSGDTAWLMTSSALVLLMTVPGLALFYAGLVRSKNALSILMQCFIAAGLVSVLWVLAGYSIAFSGDGLLFGNLGKFALAGITPDTLWGTIPEYVFVMFQAMFAIITPALMIGAFAERMRFGPYLAFIGLWVLLVYAPLAHMVWGGGMISQWGALDFAGGLVVHMSSGFSALTAAIFLGKRRGYREEAMPPHSLPLTVIGAALLWVGWFGFNAGSQLAADGIAGLAFLTTNTATATSVVTWVGVEWLHRGKPTVLGAATAAVAGLVAITPACAFVSPMGSIAVGFGAGTLCYAAVTLLKPALGYDDSLDVFGVHGIGGAWGALATGLFVWSYGAAGDAVWTSQVLTQLKSIVFTAIFCPVITLVILFALRAVFGNLRLSEDDEILGLDLAEHSESAYAFGGLGMMAASGSAGERASAPVPAPGTSTGNPA